MVPGRRSGAHSAWLAALATPVAMLTSLPPFLYNSVVLTGGSISSTAHVRHAVAAATALA
jgi:hypothetical protein